MLKSLLIQNYAIIESLEIQFSEGLNIITGETGAGKSILTGALGLIQGNRADTKVLYDANVKCVVEAEFDSDNAAIRALFEEEDIEFEQTIIIRRTISAKGKSRAFVNDEPVKLGFLKALSILLVDMHRQFDTIGINEAAVQLEMLDSVAENATLLEDYQRAYAEYKRKLKTLQELQEAAKKANQELDYLQFQLNELEEENFQEDEQESLEAEVELLSNAEGIISSLQKVSYSFEEGEQNIIQQLTDISNELNRLGIEQGPVYELNQRIIALNEELRDINLEANSIAQGVEVDPRQLEEKTNRLNRLFALLQKHQMDDLATLLDFQASLRTKINGIAKLDDDQSELIQDIETIEKQLFKKAEQLHTRRTAQIPTFQKKIIDLVANLGMEHAQFDIQCTKLDTLTASGMNQLQFLFSANPGKAPQDLKAVASGGELSRLALSLKTVVADHMELGTLIFDEIDTGISGDVAGKMGKILKDLSSGHQIISITHSPQIAAQATKHFFIYKEIENNRTYTKVQTLSEADRIIEIAKMLSGNPPSDSARKHAKELIAG